LARAFCQSGTWKKTTKVTYITTTVGAISGSTNSWEPAGCGAGHSPSDFSRGWAGPLGWMMACGSRYCINQGYSGGLVQEILGTDPNNVSTVACF